ncbi:MAG: MFS transporter [Candidatus Thorarchaeota archaeon]
MANQEKVNERQKRQIKFFNIVDYIRGEGLPSYFKESNIQLVKIILSMGLFFAGFNLSLFFDTVLLKEFLCSPQIYSCAVAEANKVSATSTYNLIRAMNLVIYMAALVIGGAISDDLRTRFGNRLPMIMTGSIIAGLGYLLMPFIVFGANFAIFTGIIIYGIIGIGFGFSLAPEYSLISELFKKEERGWAGLGLAIFGTLGTVIGLGINIFLVGPFIDNQPGEINWKLILLLVGIIIIFMGFLTFIFTPRLNPPFPADSTLQDIINTPKYLLSLGQGNKCNRDFFLMIFVSMLWGGAGFILGTNLPSFIYELKLEHYASFDAGTFLMVMGIAGAVFAAPAGVVIARIGKVKGGMFASGLFTFFALILTVNLFWGDLQIVFLALLGGLATIFITTVNVSLPADLVPRGKEGQFMGIFVVASALLGPILGIISFIIISNSINVLTGYSLVFIFSALLYGISFALLGFMQYEKQLETEYQQFYRRYLVVIKHFKIKTQDLLT